LADDGAVNPITNETIKLNATIESVEEARDDATALLTITTILMALSVFFAILLIKTAVELCIVLCWRRGGCERCQRLVQPVRRWLAKDYHECLGIDPQQGGQQEQRPV